MKYHTSPVKIFLLSLLRRSKEFIEQMINAVSKCELLFKKAMEIKKKYFKAFCISRKYLHSPQRRIWISRGGGGVCKTKTLILRNIWSLVQISDGRGCYKKIPSREVWKFSGTNHFILKITIKHKTDVLIEIQLFWVIRL